MLQNQVYIYSTTGSLTDNFDLTNIVASTAYGITFHNDLFYILNAQGKIFIYSNERSYVREFNYLEITGITGDVNYIGSYRDKLYIGNNSTRDIYIFNDDEYITKLDLISDNGDNLGMTFYNDHLYVVDGTDLKVYIYPAP